MIPTSIKNIETYDHITFWVGNAKQASSYYCSKFGFDRIAVKDLETGDREYATHVVRQNRITLSFVSSLTTDNKEFAKHMEMGGDGIKDLAFTVDDAKLSYSSAVEAGAVSIKEPYELSDENGIVIMATIASPIGNLTHTFVQRNKYTGEFLPGFSSNVFKDPLTHITGPVGLKVCDHHVYCVEDNTLLKNVDWYERVMGFHQYWTPSEKIKTETSELSSIVVADPTQNVKIPINQTEKRIQKSQVEEYIDFYGRAGIQHIALTTDNIVDSIDKITKRGVELMRPPKHYYDVVKPKMAAAGINVTEGFELLEKYGIFVDNDEKAGYLLQVFTKPMQDRPTFIVEIIQKVENSMGFGAGNFKSIFEAIEIEQTKRGNS
ncbi:hypothetical protein PPL_07822 [Heterostelium album PN500]|uniref:4-hydroxyphenylpyruvate dioxygenase n=1 Tax=Heterostelium pallidum (strain ATCC 26659 / Pp 5 / PN500) TaxID=670386 RepID=D3BH20_HETP5|nr:hypothetical protein PPL_07822 [Heterostelium album PN500]EFA79404.1 hypothetical protein PPL_07822 [Heterostelium album PN500]|eukprot:XP_020431525.1 hypothetical protein PPL_07822 [Heterostelium album PN500]